jgi:hypothetical protein
VLEYLAILVLFFIGGFGVNIGVSCAFNVELLDAMYAIELAFTKGWRNLWLETHSMLVFFSLLEYFYCSTESHKHMVQLLHRIKSVFYFFSHLS